MLVQALCACLPLEGRTIVVKIAGALGEFSAQLLFLHDGPNHVVVPALKRMHHREIRQLPRKPQSLPPAPPRAHPQLPLIGERPAHEGEFIGEVHGATQRMQRIVCGPKIQKA